MEQQPLVGVLVGSRTDEPRIEDTFKVLNDLGVPYEYNAMSAHRSPQRVMEYVTTAEERGIEVIIAAAGGSAALPGVVASWTTLPVIGVPLPSSDMQGIDALYTIAQMPPGVPVACVAIGAWGARNAAYLAASILSIKHPAVHEAYAKYREGLRNA
ncbi:MAG: 5-(carboxyamino)imidazole ribonucleotide mutase [Chloroflexota bacterium]|nr:5-(carboxyamino)imidazole ribonucleotide mutase [Chloroflexota bacterium]MDE2969372.1 5-(carboxyamino)imidazole ribonucleotide mutase [Chloroflexota bacterium]